MTGNNDSYDVAGSLTPDIGWFPSARTDATHIIASSNSQSTYLSVPYLTGSVITRLRVKYAVNGTNIGIKLTLLKRDESGSTTAWTTVGSEQTYTTSGAPSAATVSTYDISDETLAANCSYMLRITSSNESGEVYLYSIGIETSKRVY